MLESLSGNVRSYRILLDEVAKRLRFYFLRRLPPAQKNEAEDLVQETLIALHKKRATYQIEKPFTAWLHAIARHKLLDYFRQQRSSITVPLDDSYILFADDLVGQATDRMDVEKLLENIPERQRKLIVRTKIAGESIADVALDTNMTETSVKVSIHRGIKAIAAKLGVGKK